VSQTTTNAFVLAVSLGLHAAVLAAGAWIHWDRVAIRGDPEQTADAEFEMRVVARDEPADDVVAPAPPLRRDVIPAPRAGEDPIAAFDIDLFDFEPPPAAVPTLAVIGGVNTPVPSSWSPRPSMTRSSFSGLGLGGKRGDGHGRGGTRNGVVGGHGAVVPVPTPPVADPPPPVRIAARIVSYTAPDYPESARHRGLEGIVRLEADVTADASVDDVRVVESSRVQAFDDAAVHAVRSWRFAPATIDGVAVASTFALPPIRFRLE
jgi:TonB family protein